MSHLLRSKRTSIQTDLSAGIFSELLAPDEVVRYGINSQINALAFDPVQSLLAVGTKGTVYGTGQIYIFGQKRVFATYPLPRKASVLHLRFCVDKLVVVDDKNEVTILSLEEERTLSSYALPGRVTAVETDPSLDWVFLGMHTGEVIIYDIDRQILAPLKLPYLWKEGQSKKQSRAVISLALHPRDLGKMLLGYSEGAVIYSFKQDKATNFFRYELPPGAPGGSPNVATVDTVRHPSLTHALWHPAGTFILTGHEDSTMVIWDLREERIVMARTVQDINVNKVGGLMGGTGSRLRPLVNIAWCSKQNPEDTGLLIAGGSPTEFPSNGLIFLDLGVTPNYATSSWQVLADHFGSPQRQHILPTPPDADVVDVCLIPRSSPHYSGAHDPAAIIALLSSGELLTLSFPSGQPLLPANLLHISLSFVHPFVNAINLSSVELSRWLSMREERQQQTLFLYGGAEASRPRKRHERRSILQTIHTDGTIRLWDAGHADEIDNEDVLQVDVGAALSQFGGVEVVASSLADEAGEFAVGTKSGEVAVFRWGKNDGHRQAPHSPQSASRGLVDISDRADRSLTEGFLPLTLYRANDGPVSAMKMSNVGFLGIGFRSGKIAMIDMRGPAVIYDVAISTLIMHHKRRSLLGGHVETGSQHDYVTAVEFGILTVEGDDYSSICCFLGTNIGHVLTLKLLPESNGTFRVQYVGFASLEAPIITISPINAETGDGAYASQVAMAKLRSGHRMNGVLVVASASGASILKPASGNGAHKTWQDIRCFAAAVVKFEDRAHCLLGVFGDGSVRAFSLPAFKELAAASIGGVIDVSRLSDILIGDSGFVFAWTGPSEIVAFNVWGSGRGLPKSDDKLYNSQASVPPRPTISNLQWIAGSQHVTPADMDLLIGGPERPMSRRVGDQPASQARPRHAAGEDAGQPSEGQEGYWAYMQRQINERTEKLGMVGESMDQLQERSASWAKDVNKYVNQQKRNVLLGGVKSKFGL